MAASRSRSRSTGPARPVTYGGRNKIRARADLIGRNVIALIDLPAGKPGRPSRAMTQDQAAKVLKTANGGPTGYGATVMDSAFGDENEESA